MNIPNFENVQFTERGGYLTDTWALILQQLITELQQNVSDLGYQLPQLTSAEIGNLQSQFAASDDPTLYYGNMLYDTTTDEMKVNIAGTFKVVQVV